MNEQFENILFRSHNGSMKWEAPYIEKRFGLKVEKQDKVYPLFIADMDYDMAPAIKEKLERYLQTPDFGYFHVQENFYTSIMNWYNQKISRDWIVPSLGTVTSLNILCELYANKQNIMMFTPVYGSFKNLELIGQLVTCPLVLKEMTYEIDFKKFEENCENQSIKVLVLCNPHNPSGRIWRRAEIAKIVDICKKHQILLLSDEIHSDFKTSDETFVSISEYFDVYDRMVVSTSANKIFNISSLTTSYILCPNKEIRQAFEGYFTRMHLSYNRMGIEMTALAYENGREWLDQLNQNIKENIALVSEKLQGCGIEIMRPESGYLVWMRLPKVKDVDQFVRELANHTHVLVETGSRFIENYDGFVRVNVATSKAILSAAMELFADFYANYNQE